MTNPNPNWEIVYQGHPLEVEDATEYWAAMAERKVVECPCCKKVYNTLYRRNISPAMVQCLIHLDRGHGGIHHASVGDFSKLVHWELIGKGSDGEWYMTYQGKRFLAGDMVPKYAYIQNNVVVGHSAEMTTINRILAMVE